MVANGPSEAQPEMSDAQRGLVLARRIDQVARIVYAVVFVVFLVAFWAYYLTASHEFEDVEYAVPRK